jgi:hypothetical protein
MRHTVFFRLRSGLTDGEREKFLGELRRIGESENVSGVRVGRGASTVKRLGVTDKDWDYVLMVEFEDLAAHDRYQDPSDEVHRRFIEACHGLWERVVVYDIEEC